MFGFDLERSDNTGSFLHNFAQPWEPCDSTEGFPHHWTLALGALRQAEGLGPGSCRCDSTKGPSSQLSNSTGSFATTLEAFFTAVQQRWGCAIALTGFTPALGALRQP